MKPLNALTAAVTGGVAALGVGVLLGAPAAQADPPGTHWYHPHCHGATHNQVASGMAGFLIIEGDVDTALNLALTGERRPDPTFKTGPYDYRERLMLIQRVFLTSSDPDAHTQDLKPGGGGGGTTADVAINGRDRPLFFNHRRLDEALGAYLDERVRASHGLGAAEHWRGLDRHGPLFLGAEGEVYPITPNGGEGQNRYVCRPLLEIYRKIFRQADIPGLCTQSARLTLMSRMYERGADEDQVGLVLGIADRSAVREQLPRPRPELAKVLEELA